MNGWFNGHSSYNIAVERAMILFDSLLLTSDNTAEQHVSDFTDIMDDLDLGQDVLPVNYQVRLFVKGVIDPAY